MFLTNGILLIYFLLIAFLINLFINQYTALSFAIECKMIDIIKLLLSNPNTDYKMELVFFIQLILNKISIEIIFK